MKAVASVPRAAVPPLVCSAARSRGAGALGVGPRVCPMSAAPTTAPAPPSPTVGVRASGW
eukprot:4278352-Prymnesium_polylepis.1